MKWLTDILKSVGLLVVSCAALSVPLAIVMYGINWMRTYGLPIDSFVALPDHWTAPTFSSGPLAELESMIKLYNMVFPGYARFGSGLGILIAAFWTGSQVKTRNLFSRAVIGFSCGAVIGGRSALMVSSSPRFVLFGMCSGAVLGAICLVATGKAPAFDPLPRLDLSSPGVK